MTEASEELGEAVRRRMPVLDGWRGAAILVVVLHNAGYVMVPDGSTVMTLTRVVLDAGWVGVSLFFVLSGFLITGILLDTHGSPTYFRDFYVRRTLRIFPLYYGFLVIALVIVPRLVGPGPYAEAVRANQVWYWLYLSNWTHLMQGGIPGLPHIWSLAVEEQFYLVWPLFLFLVGPARFGPAAIVVVLGSFLGRCALYRAGMQELTYSFTVSRADCLALGALMAVVARRPDWRAAVWRHRTGALVATCIPLAAVVLLAKGLEGNNPWVPTIGQTLIGLAFALSMLATLAPERRFERGLAGVMSLAWLRSLGKYSYAVYIFHVPLHALARDAAEPWVNAGGPLTRITLTFAYSLLVLGASFLLALASWHLYEKHFLALKDRLAPRG